MNGINKLQVCLLAVKIKLLLIPFNNSGSIYNIKHGYRLYDASGQWGIFVSQTFSNKTLSFACWATGTHPALFVCCLYKLKLKLQ